MFQSEVLRNEMNETSLSLLLNLRQDTISIINRQSNVRITATKVLCMPNIYYSL